MALSPYKGHHSPLNRSRSSSCSSPIRNRVVYQEIYSVGANTLVRSFSCDQVINKDDYGQTFQTTQIQFSSFLTPEKKKYGNGMVATVNPNQVKKLKPKLSEKPDEVKSQEEPKVKPKRSSKSRLITSCIILPILSSVVCYYYLKYKECSYVWDLNKTENELQEKVFGQNDALLKINMILNKCNNSNDIYAMAFTGSVGVGKTYTSSIISHNFPWSSSKLISYTQSFNSDIQNYFVSDLARCGCNLLIVDDLTVASVNNAVSFLNFVANKRKHNEKVLIILIFQVHKESDRTIIVTELEKSYVYFYHIPFKKLSEDVVRKCYDVEIKKLGVNTNKEELDKLVQERIAYVDVVKGPTGCKGVADDVSYFYTKKWE